jgi:hypothetical protein
MTAYDPRLTPARADLAAKALAGKVDAKRYVEGHVREIVEPQAPLRREPAPDAPLATEALKGERVTIYDENGEAAKSRACGGSRPRSTRRPIP